MGTVATLHIHQFAAYISHGAVFIAHLCHVEVAHHRDAFLFVLHHVEVAVEQSANSWCIGDDRGNLVKVELVQAHGKVLQQGAVVVFGIDFHTRAIIGNEVYLGVQLLVVAKEQVVVFIELELLIAQHGTIGKQVHVQSAVCHLCLDTQLCAQLSAGIIVAGIEAGATLQQIAIEERGKDKLGIAPVVAHPATEVDLIFSLLHQERDGVDAHTVNHHGVNIAIAIEASLRGGVETELQRLEMHLVEPQEVGKRILLAAIQIQAHGGQQGTQLRFVDDAVGNMVLHGIEQGLPLCRQLIVIARGIEVKEEVAAVHRDTGGVGGGEHIQLQRGGSIYFLVCADGEVVDGGLHTMVVFQVAHHVGMGAQGGCQWFFAGTQGIHIYMRNVCTNGGSQLGFADQCLSIYSALQQLVVAIEMQSAHTLVECHGECHLVEIPGAIAQLIYAGIDLQLGAWRQHIGAPAIQRGMGRDGVDGITGHEVMHIELLDVSLCLIGQAADIGIGIQLHPALALGQSASGAVLRAIGIGSATQGKSIGNVIGARHIGRQQGGDKRQVLRGGIKGKMSSEASEIIEREHIATQLGTEGGGQLCLCLTDEQMLHIACRLCLEHQRLVGIGTVEGCGQGLTERQDILSAQRGKHTHIHPAGMKGVEHVQVHLHGSLDMRERSAEGQRGYGEVQRVHIYRGCALRYLQTALLLHPAITQAGRHNGVAIADRINAKTDA